MRASFYRYAKQIPLVAGFIFGVIGSVWSFVVVGRHAEELKHLSEQKARVNSQVQSLGNIASEYFIANQQGDLIFVLAQQGAARRDVAGLIYKGNLLDRATPVRNMIGALAIAKEVDYRQTYGAYEKLNDAARLNLTAELFFELKQMEKEIIAKGQERVPVLINKGFEIDQNIAVLEAAQKTNHAIGLASSILGSFLLLLANLIAKRSPEGK